MLPKPNIRTMPTRSSQKRKPNEEDHFEDNADSKRSKAVSEKMDKSQVKQNKVKQEKQNPKTRPPVKIEAELADSAEEVYTVDQNHGIQEKSSINNDVYPGTSDNTPIHRSPIIKKPDDSNLLRSPPKSYTELKNITYTPDIDEMFDDDMYTVDYQMKQKEFHSSASETKEKAKPIIARKSNLEVKRVDTLDEGTSSSSALVGHKGNTHASSVSTVDSTTKGMWNPIAFVQNNLYNKEKGVPLSRAECEDAIKKLWKNDRPTDYYPFLELAQKFHNKSQDLEEICCGMAFNTVMQNKIAQKIKKCADGGLNDELNIIDGNGFSIDEAKMDEPVIKLPSGRRFKMSYLLTSHQTSKWTSTKFTENSKSLLRAAFKKLAAHDEFFATYSPLDYSTNSYYPIGAQFYRDISRFVYKGFKQKFSLELESKCSGMAREVLQYLMDRFRKEYNNNSDISTSELAKKLGEKMVTGCLDETEINFNEDPIHRNFKCLQY